MFNDCDWNILFVSLAFTGIAVSVLSMPVPEYARMIQDTIVAAEIIKKACEKIKEQ